MSYYFKNIRPGYDSGSDVDDELDDIIRKNTRTGKDDESSDDELRTLSFGSLKKANDMLSKDDEEEARKVSPAKIKARERKFKEEEEEVRDNFIDNDSEEVSESESDSEDDGFFEDEEGDAKDSKRNKKKKNKHAPTEQSSKKRVSRIRKIPGLEMPKTKNSNLYKDIRFDKSTGQPTDSREIRRRYQFLDEYREKEIKEMEKLLKDRKFTSKISDHEQEQMQGQLKSMKSRLQTVKNKDLEHEIIKKYEQDINKDNKTKYHLKENEKRKVIQKWKFDHMKAKQREKVMERKRKKRLGKEFKQFEFHKNR